VLLLVACKEDPTGKGGSAPLPEDVLVGRYAEEGFGARLAWHDGRIWVGAPFGGRIYLDGTVVLAGESGSFLGAGLASGSGGLLVGSPGTGEILDGTGAVVASGTQLGGVIATDGEAWAASTADGAQREDGTTRGYGARPDALCFCAGDLALGFARDGLAVRWRNVAISRVESGDELGYSLACHDGRLYVGAPGAGRVYRVEGSSVVEVAALGRGRFGASLAFDHEGTLWVGAPMDGSLAAGAVYRVEGDEPVLLESGAEGDELGTAILAEGGNVYAGAPGAPGTPGSVRILVP
jgi:hypothetical protein